MRLLLALAFLSVEFSASISSGAITSFSGTGVAVPPSGLVMNTNPDSTGFGFDGTLSMIPSTGDYLQFGFNEKQSFTLTADLVLGSVTIPQSTVVDSHTIFLNLAPGDSAVTQTTWEFDGEILALATSTDGSEYASTNFLGAPGVLYTPIAFANEGLESGDVANIINPTTLALTLSGTQPGDWVRVITVGTPIDVVPEPSSLVMMALGVLGYAGYKWRRRRKKVA